MERDFMGLSCKEPLALVKEEVNSEGFKEIGYSMGLGVQWPFSSKVSGFPQFMSFKVNQNDKTTKIGVDSLPSSGFSPLSTLDLYDQKRSVADIQKSFNRQGGSKFSLSAYSVQPEVHGANRSYDAKMIPKSNQLFGGVPVTHPRSVLPTTGSIGRTTGPWNSVKASASASPPLTIFYNGTVNVFDDISPEKVQAIMFLAGKGSFVAHQNVQAQCLKPVAVDGVHANDPSTTPPNSGLSSPLSVSSHTGPQSGSGSTSTDDVLAAKAVGVTTTPVSKVESLQMVNMLRSSTTMIPSVPQARKASLARFLEKRKERVTSASPYDICKKSPNVEGSNVANYASTSAAGISSLLDKR